MRGDTVRRSIPQIAVVGTVALGLGLVTLISSCGGGGGNARLRVVHASPDEGSIDVLIDSKTIASGITFGTATSYTSLSSGSRHLQMEPSDTATPVIDETLSLGSGSDTTVLLANFATSLNAVTLQDDNSAPTSGNAKLRIINAAPGLAPADVYIVPDGTDINSVTPVLSSMGFESASSYTSLGAGTYRVWFTQPGQKFIFIDSGPLPLSAGQIRSVVGLNNSFGSFSSTVLSDLN